MLFFILFIQAYKYTFLQDYNYASFMFGKYNVHLWARVTLKLPGNCVSRVPIIYKVAFLCMSMFLVICTTYCNNNVILI